MPKQQGKFGKENGINKEVQNNVKGILELICSLLNYKSSLGRDTRFNQAQKLQS